MGKYRDVQMATLEDLMEWHLGQMKRYERLSESHQKKYEGHKRYGDSVMRQDTRLVEFHRMAAAVCAKALDEKGNVSVPAERRLGEGLGRCTGLAHDTDGAGPETICVPENGPEVCRVPDPDPAPTVLRSEEDHLPQEDLGSLAKRARATPGFHWPSTGT